MIECRIFPASEYYHCLSPGIAGEVKGNRLAIPADSLKGEGGCEKEEGDDRKSTKFHVHERYYISDSKMC